MDRVEGIIYGVAMTLIALSIGGLGVVLLARGVGDMPRIMSVWLGALCIVGGLVGLHAAYTMVSSHG